MKYNQSQRLAISEDAKGKTILSMYWDDVGEYWVIDFTDESQMCVRLMAELC